MFRKLCSFDGQTLVTTDEGLKPISELEVGDKVLAFNEETGEIDFYDVSAIWVHTDEDIAYLLIDGELIITTNDHPFFTPEGTWTPVEKLEIGDMILKADWTMGRVDGLVFLNEVRTMYNLTVDEAHTYFVGQDSLLVHNSCSLYFTTKQLQEKWKHAHYFGINLNWSLKNAEAFKQAIIGHVNSPNVTRIVGEWRKAPAIHYYDENLNLNVITDLDGNFITGFGNLSDASINNLRTTGSLGGGP